LFIITQSSFLFMVFFQPHSFSIYMPVAGGLR
jgi:hypothetical protein